MESSPNRAIYASFVSADPLTPSFSRPLSSLDTSMQTSDSTTSANNANMPSESCNVDKNYQKPLKVAHSDDTSLWLYHIESTTSTMDEAKSNMNKTFPEDNNCSTNDGAVPTSFVVLANSQSNGQGTLQRNLNGTYARRNLL